MAKIYDCFPFFNELDILEIRLNEMNDIVDKFVLVEATKTHQKKDKPLYFEMNKERFAPFLHKIEHVVVDSYPNFFTHWRKPKTWDFERNQTNFVSQGLKNCAPDDVIILSDIDEIPRKELVLKYKDVPGLKVFEQKLYYYFLDCHVTDHEEPFPFTPEGYRPWNGTVMVHYKDFQTFEKHRTSRNNPKVPKTVIPNGGWHYSWLGGVEKILQKIEAYTHKEHNTEDFKNPERIKKLILSGDDLFGRRFKTQLVDPKTDAPEYVQKHLDKYAHLILQKQ